MYNHLETSLVWQCKHLSTNTKYYAKTTTIKRKCLSCTIPFYTKFYLQLQQRRQNILVLRLYKRSMLFKYPVQILNYYIN